MTSNNQFNNEQAQGLLAGFLVACKVPANWAKVIAGAIAGAIAAWLALSTSSCSAGMELSLKSAHGELNWQIDGGSAESGATVAPVIIQASKK